MVVYYTSRGKLLSAPVTEGGAMYVRDLRLGEHASVGEDYIIQYWQGLEGGNYFFLRTLNDFRLMQQKAKEGKSRIVWMAGNAQRLGVPMI